MMITRHSSRRARLDQAVLNERLVGAVSYDRIAGYFRSSLFEVAGELLMAVTGRCGLFAIRRLMGRTWRRRRRRRRREWCSGKPEEAARQMIDRTVAMRNPFDVKYSKVEDADWETCTTVLNPVRVEEILKSGW